MIIRASASPGEVRAVAEADGVCIDVAIERTGQTNAVGDIHRGRIDAHVPALGGAFVILDGAVGFLPDSAGGRAAVGSSVSVRVVRAAQGGKGPRLAMAEMPAGSGPPCLLQRGPGAVERLAAQHPGVEVWVDDPALMATLQPRIGARLKRVSRAFDDSTESELAALAHTDVALPGGGRMSIWPTPALVAIDLDLGSGAAEKAGRRRVHESANRTALPALAAQIRLRNLGGAIVVDLAGMPVRQRASLGNALAEALANDPLLPRFLGFTGLGLAEILRPRMHPPLHELLAGPHAAGLAGLRALAAECAARPAIAVALRTTPAIATALMEDTAARDDVRRMTGRPLILREDHSLPPPHWSIEPA